MGRPSRYPEQFRREAVQMALASNESRAAVARRLGVNETTLRKCVANLSGPHPSNGLGKRNRDAASPGKPTDASTAMPAHSRRTHRPSHVLVRSHCRRSARAWPGASQVDDARQPTIASRC